MSEPLLEVQSLRIGIWFEGREVFPVEDVSISIAPGRRVGLVGESGSGKSMTARALLDLFPIGLVSRMEGEAYFGGSPVYKQGLDRREDLRRSDVGIVFQDASAFLNPTRRIGKQILEALPEEVLAEEAEARLVDVLASVGLPDNLDFARRYPHELSGGQRQRVLLALAMIKQPRLLIADEPTTALDVSVQAQVLYTIRRLSLERSMSLLLITHDLAVVAGMCEDVYVMYAGQIVESGPVEEVFSSPRHPYTAALLASVLTLASRGGDRLPYIRGTVPSFGALPGGCRFAPRCAFATNTCLDPVPLTERGPRAVRCVHSEELELQGV